MAMIMGRAPLRYPTIHPATPAPALLGGAGPVLLRLATLPLTNHTAAASIARLAVDQRGHQV